MNAWPEHTNQPNPQVAAIVQPVQFNVRDVTHVIRFMQELKVIDREKLSVEEYKTKRDQLLMAWQYQKDVLQQAKDLEMDLRKLSVEFISDADKESGTENIELGGGYIAKTVKKINYSWVKTGENKIDKIAIDDALFKIEEDGDVGKMIAERLVKWTPELSLTEYKLLSEKHKTIIDAVVIKDEAAPTLEIKEPKVKR